MTSIVMAFRRISGDARQITSSVMMCLFLFLAPLAEARLHADAREATFSLDAESPILTLHEPILVELAINNGAGDTLTLDLGEDCRSNIRLIVIAPDGAKRDLRIPRTPEGGFDSECVVRVQPGKTYKRKLLLNEWFDPWLPGRYQISIVLENGSTGAAARAWKASTIIQVGPRDPERLKEVCAALAADALSPRAQEALEASEALGFVTDEVCIPSFRRVLKESFHGKEGAVKGLAQLGTADAISALIEAWGRLEPDQRSLAVLELTRQGRVEALDVALAKAGLSRLR